MRSKKTIKHGLFIDDQPARHAGFDRYVGSHFVDQISWEFSMGDGDGSFLAEAGVPWPAYGDHECFDVYSLVRRRLMADDPYDVIITDENLGLGHSGSDVIREIVQMHLKPAEYGITSQQEFKLPEFFWITSDDRARGDAPALHELHKYLNRVEHKLYVVWLDAGLTAEPDWLKVREELEGALFPKKSAPYSLNIKGVSDPSEFAQRLWDQPYTIEVFTKSAGLDSNEPLVTATILPYMNYSAVIQSLLIRPNELISNYAVLQTVADLVEGAVKSNTKLSLFRSEDSVPVSSTGIDFNAMSRNQVISFMEKLTDTQFTRIAIRVENFNDEVGTVPQRVAALILYIESSVGPGFDHLKSILSEIFVGITPPSHSPVAIKREKRRAINENKKLLELILNLYGDQAREFMVSPSRSGKWKSIPPVTMEVRNTIISEGFFDETDIPIATTNIGAIHVVTGGINRLLSPRDRFFNFDTTRTTPLIETIKGIEMLYRLHASIYFDGKPAQ